MKKFIGLILVVAIIAAAGYFSYDLYFSKEATAERNLMGEWIGSNYEIGGFTFEEDGVLKINIGNLSADGKYTVNYETGEMSMEYSWGGLSYEKEYTFDVTEDSLKLTDKTLGITTNYIKANEQ